MKKITNTNIKDITPIRVLRKIITQFLIENGGMYNGYDTFLEGTYNTYTSKLRRSIEIHLPTEVIEQWTIKQYRQKQDFLENQINIFLSDNHLRGIIFTPNHIEDGCYHTIIETIQDIDDSCNDYNDYIPKKVLIL